MKTYFELDIINQKQLLGLMLNKCYDFSNCDECCIKNLCDEICGNNTPTEELLEVENYVNIECQYN